MEISAIIVGILVLAGVVFLVFDRRTAKSDPGIERQQADVKTALIELKERLDGYQKQLQQSDSSRTDILGQLKQRLGDLSQTNQKLADETEKFRSVLKSNQARGKWGEETLRRVVEAAGMSSLCDFTEQAVSGENRPDLIVRLPEDHIIIVDSKVPDFDFLSALGTTDSTKRNELLSVHATKLKATIKALADKDYPHQFPGSLDYVVLFIPAESLFSAALEGDHDLIVWAAERKILLATPASLIALLRSVSVSWQQYKQTENTKMIVEAVKELYTRIVKFTGYLEDIRTGLDKANNAFNSAVSSYQTRVKPSGERLIGLGGIDEGKKLPDVNQLDPTLKTITE